MNKPKLDATNGFHVYGWMVTDLHLQGGDLFAFALVHQFAQSNAGFYRGNTTYLSQWTGWTEKTSRTHLFNLVKMGLIREYRGRDNNTPFCYYELTEDFYQKHQVKITASPGKNFQKHPVKISESTGEKLPGEYNNKEYKERIEGGRFTPPSVEEVRAYCLERNNGIDADEFVDFYTSKGWKIGKETMKDWKAAVRTWEKRRRETAPAKATRKTLKRID